VEVFYHGCKRSMGTFCTQDDAALANMTARQILDQTNDASLTPEEVAANIETAKKAGKVAVQGSGGQMSSHGNSHFGTGPSPSKRTKKAKKATVGKKKKKKKDPVPDPVAPEQPKQQTEVTLPPVEQEQLVADPVEQVAAV